MLAALFAFYAIGMQSLVSQWRDAGDIARSFTSEIKRLKPDLPAGAQLAISQTPRMYKHAYVYLTGLPRALTYIYGEPLTVVERDEPICDTPATYHFRYVASHIEEVLCTSR